MADQHKKDLESGEEDHHRRDEPESVEEDHRRKNELESVEEDHHKRDELESVEEDHQRTDELKSVEEDHHKRDEPESVEEDHHRRDELVLLVEEENPMFEVDLLMQPSTPSSSLPSSSLPSSSLPSSSLRSSPLGLGARLWLRMRNHSWPLAAVLIGSPIIGGFFIYWPVAFGLMIFYILAGLVVVCFLIIRPSPFQLAIRAGEMIFRGSALVFRSEGELPVPDDPFGTPPPVPPRQERSTRSTSSNRWGSGRRSSARSRRSGRLIRRSWI